MRIETMSPADLPPGLVAVGVPVHAGPDGPYPAEGIPSEVGGVSVPDELDARWCERQGFTGKAGQVLAIHPLARLVPAAAPAPPATHLETGAGDPALGGPTIVLVGLGEVAVVDGERAVETVRRGAAAFVRAAGSGDVAVFLVPLRSGTAPDRACEAAALGAALASYRFDEYRTGEHPAGLRRLLLVGESTSVHGEGASGASRGARIAQSVCMARDLVNEPPSSLTPQVFVERVISRFADVPTVTVEAWDEVRLEGERLGGLLGVARGSAQPPRLLWIEYRPAHPVEIDGRMPHVALVGKGITFDSGGLSLKSAGGMEMMKTDMSGAAAVFGAVDAAAALGARICITGLAPLTENMPGGSAIKPGDVLTARTGKTIEVLNTDAEGRLVLADALALAAEAEPDAIVDLATLTGAVVSALGKEIGGLLGNDQVLIEEVRAAGERAGEPLWPLPLPDDYRVHIESEVADMRNVGRAGQASTIAAAMLLREFVGDVPWAHLDIAGTARSDEGSGYIAKGGTGVGVRTLVELVMSEQFARTIVRS